MQSPRATDSPLPSRVVPVLAVRGRLPRAALRRDSARPEPLSKGGKSSRLILSLRSRPRRVGMRPSASSGRAELGRSALGRQMSGGTIACGDLKSTRITETGLAARNRCADFPASRRVARSRRPRPANTSTTREGSAQRISQTCEGTLPIPQSRCRPRSCLLSRSACCSTLRPIVRGDSGGGKRVWTNEA